MNIICFGQQNWDFCWTGKQQLMTRLAKRGHRVLYVDPAMAMVKTVRERLRAMVPEITRAGIRKEGPGELYVYTYHHAPLIRWRLNCFRRNLALRHIAWMLGFHHPIVMSMHPDAWERMRYLKPQAVLYQAVDEWTGFSHYENNPEEAEHLRRMEEDLIRNCDIAFGVSPVLQARMAKVNPRTYLLESGADVDHFAPDHIAQASGHPDVRDLPRPRLGFIGQVDARLDQELLVRVAQARRDWTIVLAGRQHASVDFGVLAGEPNVHFLGYQPYERLPSVIREYDVCIVPYRSTNLTNSCSPLKVFEYLATGKPVVTTPLLGLGSSRDAVRIAEGAEEFMRAVESALADPSEGQERRLAVAAENSWQRRVDFLEQCMREAVEIAREKRKQPSTGRPLRRREPSESN